MFSGDEALWTEQYFERLSKDFVENLLTDDRSFLDKLQQQLAPSPPEVKRLAGEMLWLMMLFPVNVSIDAKLRVVRTVYEWSGRSLNSSDPMLHVLASGVGSTGQAYNQHRWRELTLLIVAMTAWSRLAFEKQRTLLRDGWEFAAWLDAIPDARNRQLRNILLHLLFPETFEPVSSFQHKRLIVRHFGRQFGIALPRESTSLPVDAFDKPLAEIRKRLEEQGPDRRVDFYDTALLSQWRPSEVDDDEREPSEGAGGKSRRPSSPEPSAPLEEGIEPRLSAVVRIAVNLSKTLPDLRQKPAFTLLVSAIMHTIHWERRDTARVLWDEVRGAGGPDTTVAMLELFGLPQNVSQWAFEMPLDDYVASALQSEVAGGVRRVLSRAEQCAREVSGEAAPSISGRHLIGSLLEPGAMNSAKQALVERGCRLDRIRAVIFDFFQSTLTGDNLDAWRRYLGVQPSPPVLPEPGFARDYIDPGETDLAPDHLGVDADVQALARLLAARTVEPPLSVGLFADWGTGKSTFMQRLKWNINELSRRAAEAEKRGATTAYQTGVVQIWFNAWHYMDANLWASMVTHIFEELEKHLIGKDRSARALEEARKKLYGNLAANQGLLSDAERRKSLATSESEKAQERLETARGQQSGIRAQISAARKLATGIAEGVAEEVRSASAETAASSGAPADAAVDPEAAKAVDEVLTAVVTRVNDARTEAATALGVEKVSISEIRGSLAQMRGLWGNVSASAEILHRRRNGWVLLLLLGAVVVALTAAPLFVFGVHVAAGWLSAAAAFFVAASPAIGVLAAAAAKVRRVLERSEAEIRGAAERAEAEAQALEREVERLRQLETAAERDRVQAEHKMKEVESEIAEIQAGRRLERFISDRAGSDDYQRHLGIIATIRRDFAQLETLLDQVREAAAQPDDDAPPAAEGQGDGAPPRETPPVRRIILYIDDLDRCPEDRVVEVLQAVHLLLAFPLFVVVVGVDPRWLLRAVQSQYERLLASQRDTEFAGIATDDAVHWASTPQNYLEKIFQVPFTLEPMNPKGFSTLLGSLMKVRAAATPAAQQQPPTPYGQLPTTVATDEPAPEPQDEEEMPSDMLWLDDENDEEEPAPGTEPDDNTGLNPPGLEVEEWELAYLGKLAPLIGSPRMAKRFANVYRFIRAGLAGPELDVFRGTADQPGEFRAAGILLAVLTGFPGESVEIFRALLSGNYPKPEERWTAFVRSIAPEPDAARTARKDGALPARRWDRLRAAMDEVERDVNIEQEMESYRKWADNVARYSFQTGQIRPRRPVPQQ